ncbi:MAG: globin family protein [Myxococcota bacterium]
MLTTEEIEYVQDTWKAVIPISETAAELFYGKLFELDPTLRPLFKSDMTEQGKKLMQMIGTAVAHLTKLGDVVPAVEALGRRHVGYGVADAHYDTVGQALLWTLGQGLGDAFTDDVEAAWTKVYVTLATVMKDAAAETPAAAVAG